MLVTDKSPLLLERMTKLDDILGKRFDKILALVEQRLQNKMYRSHCDAVFVLHCSALQAQILTLAPPLHLCFQRT